MNKLSFGLIGHPLGHSISPAVHQHLFNLSGLDAEYNLYDIPPEDLSKQWETLRQLDGFNITIPYKQTVFPLLDIIDRSAAQYRAANTAQCMDGETKGFNTDVIGFHKALETAAIPLAGHVLLCGTGGVSHMMAYEALRNDCSLTIGARTFGKAATLADKLSKRFPRAQIEPAALAYVSGSYDLILNGTPVGMYPHTKKMPIPLNVARSSRAVFDAIYNPQETQLLARARAAGAKVQNGLPMLVWQAAAAQEIWTGKSFSPADIDAICQKMRAYIKENFT